MPNEPARRPGVALDTPKADVRWLLIERHGLSYEDAATVCEAVATDLREYARRVRDGR